MKTNLLLLLLLLFIIFIFLPFTLNAQSPTKASKELPIITFDKSQDTIQVSVGKTFEYKLTVKAPKQKKFHGYKGKFHFIKNDFGFDNSKIFPPLDSEITIDSTKDIEKTFTLKVAVSEKNDRLIKLELKGYNLSGKETELKSNFTKKDIYVKPTKDDLSQDKGYEFWLFTGTNLDLLDGVKPKDLYFKSSYLFNLTKKEIKETPNKKKHRRNKRFERRLTKKTGIDKTQLENKIINNNKLPTKVKKKIPERWLYFTFGKNRYFSEKDSVSRISYSDLVLENRTEDSLRIIKGFYDTDRQIETNNIFLTGNMLTLVNPISKKGSKFFLSTGLGFNLQDLETSYTNQKTLFVDTLTVFRDSSITRTRPIQKDFRIRQFMGNANLGFVHILSNKKINTKTQFMVGWHILNYPFRKRTIGLSSVTEYKTRNDLYFQIRIDATVLDPGISLGFETILRKSEIPLFNVSFTKVLDIEKIGDLFGKVNPAN